MSFAIFYNEKKLFWAIKRRVSKSRKIDIFPKVNPWFWSKMAIFPTCFLGNIREEKLFYDILERESVFLDYKNKKFKKSKN